MELKPGGGRRARWSLPAAMLVVAVAGGCGQAGSAMPESPPAAAPGVVHTGAQAGDRIEGLDLAAGPDGSAHLVWRDRPDPDAGARRRTRIMYQRGHGDPLRWEAPVPLAEGAVGTQRVVAGRDGVHVLAGPRLAHWWLPSGADRWQPRPALLDERAPGARAFDVVATPDGGLVVAYTSGTRIKDAMLHTLRWHDGQAGPVQALVRHPVAAPNSLEPAPALHDPVLAWRDDRLWLLWGSRIPSAQQDTHWQNRVSATWSADAGRRWSAPMPVTAQAGYHLGGVAIASAGPAPLALFVGLGLFASQWEQGAWSPQRRLAAYEVGSLSGSAKAFHVAAASCAGRPLVAWVDGRRQRSDRRWWNPLGGIPWSDSPDWVNNDLFVLAGDGLVAVLDGRPAAPRQQTATGGHVEDIAVVDRGDHALLVWAGRASVRKSTTDMGAPPTLQYRRIECD